MVPIVAIFLPLVAGLHRYACDRGYRNLSPRESFDNACHVSTMLLIGIGVAYILSRGFQP